MKSLERLQTELHAREDSLYSGQSRTHAKRIEDIRNIKDRIARTKNTIAHVERKRVELPAPITELLESGTLSPWRNKQDIFCVDGVDKGLILWNGTTVSHRMFNKIPNEEQRMRFSVLFNELKGKL